MSDHAVRKWAQKFRAAAKADKYAVLREHLRRLELPDSPELLLEGTIEVVKGWSLYWAIDGRPEPFERFLEMQTYQPLEATDATYAFTFNIYGKAFGRILSPADIKRLDLADLYNHPWDEYGLMGYNLLYVSRADWAAMTGDEVRDLEREVTADLRFDYCEDELEFWCDDTSSETHIVVRFYEEVKEGDAEEGGD